MKAEITQVSSPQDLEEFIRFPYRLYEGDPYWVPPLLSDQRKLLSADRSAFFEHADVALWLARQDGQVVGTISSHVDHRHNQFHQESLGMFGFFETVEDYDVAEALLSTALDWVKAQGMAAMRGPLSFSQNQQCGLLLEGGEEGFPMVLMSYNPPYYADFLSRFGLTKAMDLYAYYVDLTQFKGDPDNLPRKLIRVADRVARNTNAVVRGTSDSSLSEDIKQVRIIYDQAWKDNWGFVPLTDAETVKMEEELGQIYDRDLAVGVEVEGRLAGVAMAIPDANQMLRYLDGHLFPFNWIKALWLMRSIDQSRLMILGVTDEFRGVGIEAILFYEVIKAALLKGHKVMEASWVLENNAMMNRIIQNLGDGYGVHVYRTYRLYQMDC